MRRLKRASWFLIAVCFAYLAIHVHPQPLFAYGLRYGVVALHARRPLPSNGLELLREVDARLARSPLYRSNRVYDVFLCDTPALYALFAPQHPGTGGESFFWLGNNVFIRPAKVEQDRVVGPSGKPVPGTRTLSYFIAHEVVHALTADALGTLAYARLESWQQEGYADYVASPRALDVPEALQKFRRGDELFDVERSGVYLRYQLMVTHLLHDRGMTVEALLSRPRPAAPVESELLAGH